MSHMSATDPLSDVMYQAHVQAEYHRNAAELMTWTWDREAKAGHLKQAEKWEAVESEIRSQMDEDHGFGEDAE